MDTPTPDRHSRERIGAVLALKVLPAAKSRMRSLPGPVREHLAYCMAVDTLAALAPAVDEVLVISDQTGLAAALARRGVTVRVLPEPAPRHSDGDGGSQLNRALAHGDAVLRAEGVDRVLASVGDLPALRTASVRRVLAAAATHRRCFLPDHDDLGTTMLIAHRTALDPRYGTEIVDGRAVGSAERHRRSAADSLALDAVADARWDVDTVEDLQAAHRLGLGPATAGLLDPAGGRVGDYRSVELLEVATDSITIRTEGAPQLLPRSAYDGDPAHLVPGRRLHAVRVAGAVRCWT